MNFSTAGESRDFSVRWPRFPYPGLRPFRETASSDESLIFYGRDRQKDEVIRRLAAAQLVSVVGPSGCGKSSLIKVGVIHALTAGVLTKAGPDWLVTEMRPGNEPLAAMAAALAQLGGRFDPGRGTTEAQIGHLLAAERSALWILMDHLAPTLTGHERFRRPTRALLLIDQFEEIFSARQDRRAVDQFVGLITEFFRKPHPQLYVVTTMRTDFIGQCASFPGLAEILNDTQYITPVLRGGDLREAITCPAKAYHGEVEPALVSEVMRDMGSGAAYDADHLPLMQHALLWLWQQAWSATGADAPPSPAAEWPADRPPVRLTLGEYHKHGRLPGILNRHADDILERLARGPDGQAYARLAEKTFRRLSERDASTRYKRAPALQSEVCALAGCTPAELEKVIEPFREASFIECRPTGFPDDALLDLSHESLIRQWRRLRTWADAEAEKVYIFRKFAVDALYWQQNGRVGAYLKHGNQLGLLRHWWAAQHPTGQWAARYTFPDLGAVEPGDLVELVEGYRAAGLRAQGRARLVRWLTPAAILLLLVGGGVASIMWQQAEKLRTRNDEVAKAAVMMAKEDLRHGHAARALAIAVALLRNTKAYPEDPNAEQLAIHVLNELHETNVRKLPELPAQPWVADFSQDGKYLVSAGNREIILRDTERGGRRSISMPVLEDSARPPPSVRIGPSGGRILLNVSDSVYLVTIDIQDQPETIAVPVVSRVGGDGAKVGLGAFSADGSLVVTFRRSDGCSRVWDAATGARIGGDFCAPTRSFFGPGPALNADGTMLAVPTDSGVMVFDVATGGSQDLSLARVSGRPVGGAPQSQTGGFPPQVVFHPTRPGVLAVLAGENVQLWDLVTDQPTWKSRNKIEPGGFSRLAFSPSGRFLAVWNGAGAWAFGVENGEKLLLGEHEHGVALLRFGPQNDEVYTLGVKPDETMRIWRLSTLRQPDLLNRMRSGGREDLLALAAAQIPPGAESYFQPSPTEQCLLSQVDPAYYCNDTAEPADRSDVDRRPL